MPRPLHYVTRSAGGVGPATAPFGIPALPYSVAFLCETGLKPALMRELDAQQKLKMSTILTLQVGDTVLAKTTN